MTLAVFQESRGGLKAVAFWNIRRVAVTLDTSQESRSSLNVDTHGACEISSSMFWMPLTSHDATPPPYTAS